MRRSALLLIAILALPPSAYAGPLSNADPATGKKVYDKAKCSGCHNSVMGGDGNRIYTRANHKVRNPKDLLKQVRFCVDQTGASASAADIGNIATYLNQRFYRFTQ